MVPWGHFVGVSLVDLLLHLAVPIGLLLAGYGLSEWIRRIITRVRARGRR